MTTENSKEVWECKHIINDFSWLIKNGESIAIGKISNPDDAELIVKAVNERQKLLDSNRELLEILEKISQWRKLKSDVFTYANGDGNNFDNKLKTAINNAKLTM